MAEENKKKTATEVTVFWVGVKLNYLTTAP